MSGSSELPDAPDGIPNYIRDGLEKQDIDTLKQVIEYSQDLIEHLEEPPDIEPEEGEEVLEKEKRDSYTKVVKKIPCGKDCSGCPHGPYVYHVRRKAGKLDWEYKGPVES